MRGVLLTEIAGFPKVPQAKVLFGATYTGKTQRLLLEIGSLLRGGAAASEIIVFCATPDAAQSFGTRLQALCPSARGLEVTTPHAFFLNLLDTEDARVATGRKARLLLPFEYDIFLEDLKTSGIRPQRLREILRFFYKGLSELADASEEWLVTNEERELFGMVKGWLDFTGAILGPELANLAVNYLKGSKPALDKARKNYVFVDDFQLLSRASQFASCLLANNCICLTADQSASIEVYEPYPYPNGANEFIKANPNTESVRFSTSYSCHSASKASHALRQEGGLDISGMEYVGAEELDCLKLIEGNNPQDEMVKVADTIEQLLDSGISASSIAVAAPHSVWRQNILRQLNARGIPAEMLLDAQFLKCDIRSNEKCFHARFLTALNLVADPTDAVAWRCWCGFGDYLANSDAIRSLQNICQTERKTFDAVLEEGDFQQHIPDGLGEDASIRRIANAHADAQALLGRLRGLGGQRLLEAIANELYEPGAHVPEEIKNLVLDCENGSEDEDATAMALRARACAVCPTFNRADAVRVVSYGNLVGMSPQHLFLIGFMNGFFPRREYFDGTVLTAEQMQKRYIGDLTVMASVVAKASDGLAVSYCKSLDLEAAERFKLVINRIFFEDNKRVARTEPSIFLKFIST
jgi:superfamily I DNA/RNA helicase